VKDALVADGETVTEEGTETATLLLESATENPPVGAACERVTVQTSEALPVIEAVSQFNELSEIVDVPPEATLPFLPVPSRFTFAEGLDEELFVTMRSPLDVPCCSGL